MKLILSALLMAIASQSFAYDKAECEAFVLKRNLDLPFKQGRSMLVQASCCDPGKCTKGTLIYKSIADGVDTGKMSIDQKYNFAISLKAKMKPIFCSGFKTDYPFADEIAGEYFDQNAKFLINVSVSRNECF